MNGISIRAVKYTEEYWCEECHVKCMTPWQVEQNVMVVYCTACQESRAINLDKCLVTLAENVSNASVIV